MHHSLNLASEKYYNDKIGAEHIAFRRQQASDTIRGALTFVAIFSISAGCAWLLYQSPQFIPGCIDWMRSSGILSF